MEHQGLEDFNFSFSDDYLRRVGNIRDIRGQ